MEKMLVVVILIFSLSGVFAFSTYISNPVSYFNGSVGIGTSTSGAKLHIASSDAVQGAYIAMTNTTSTYSGLNIYTTGDATQSALKVGSRIAGAGNYLSGLVVNTNGKVGIGTASQLMKLSVRVPADGISTSGSTPLGGIRVRGATFSNTVLDMGIGAGGMGNNTWIQSTDATDLSQKYILSLNPNGGNVGIGTASPTNTFDVNGKFVVNGTSGDVGIGVSDPDVKLEVKGSIIAAGGSLTRPSISIRSDHPSVDAVAGIYTDYVVSGTSTCDWGCQDVDSLSGFGISGTCLAAWRYDTRAPITCSDTTSIDKICLCAGSADISDINT